MNWLYYLGEANLYLCVFYLCYCLFLKNETHYTLNRVYLLFSCAVSLMLPLMQLGFLKSVQPIIQNAVPVTVVTNNFTWQDGVLYSYLTGALIFTIRFLIKLYQLQKLTCLKPAIINEDYKLICLEESNTAFSFFNYLFVGTHTSEKELITRHELVHIRQKHSADIIFLELFRIVNWFNPLVYLLQNSLKTVHEYIADELTATQQTDTLTYSTFLVNNACGLTGLSITHSFFNYNLLKKRIIMLNQKRSGNLARLKYLLAVPLCVGLLCESTLGFSKTYGWIDIAPQNAVNKTDTIKKRVPPPPPAPPKKTEDTKLEPPAKTKDDKSFKYPPPIVRPDKPKKSTQNGSGFKYPPPIVRPDKQDKQ